MRTRWTVYARARRYLLQQLAVCGWRIEHARNTVAVIAICRTTRLAVSLASVSAGNGGPAFVASATRCLHHTGYSPSSGLTARRLPPDVLVMTARMSLRTRSGDVSAKTTDCS